jgi:hypothetical protein
MYAKVHLIVNVLPAAAAATAGTAAGIATAGAAAAVR